MRPNFSLIWFSSLVFVFNLNFSLPVLADGSNSTNFSLREQNSKDLFELGLSYSYLSINTLQLNGIGFKFGYEYSLGDHWSFLPALALVTSTSVSQGFIYSSLEANLRYSIFGSFRQSRQELLQNGIPIIATVQKLENRLCLSIGLEQLFINGSQSVYPAAGGSAGVAYSFPVFGQWADLSFRFAEMASGKNLVSAVFLDFSLLFSGF